MTSSKLRTLTVAKLIEILQGEDPDARVLFTSDYGDHHHTAQALPIKGECEKAFVERSAYSNSGFALVQDEDCYEEGEGEGPDAESFIVIR